MTTDRLTIELADGRTLSVPLSWYPRLQHGSDTERQNWQLLGDGYAIECHVAGPMEALMRLLVDVGVRQMTTREPSLDQLEVSIRALREVLELEGRLQPADRRVEVMA